MGRSVPHNLKSTHQTEFVKIFNSLCGRYGRWEIWQDFVTLAAIAISNTVDRSQAAEREKTYMTIAGKYKPEEMLKFSQMLQEVVIGMLLAADERTNRYITSTETAGVVLDFIGGEPLLEVELVDQILGYFVEQVFRLHHPWATRWKASMSTNGTLYFRPEVQRFLEKWADHLSLSVSIDGDKQLHDSCRVFPDGSGSYDLAIAAAKDYMAKGHALGSKMTVAPGNVGYLYHAVIGLLDAGYRAINLNCVYEKGWTLDHAATLYAQLKQLADYVLALDEQPYLSIFSESIGHPLPEDDNQNWCGGTGLMLAVDCNGVFFPCLRYMGTSLGTDQKPYAIGDLEHGIMVLPEHRAQVAEMAAVTRRSQSTDECFGCPIASGCSWCSAYNYQCTGTPDKRVTYICPMHKARVLANAYYWNKLHRKQKDVARYRLDIPDGWALEIISPAELARLKALSEED